jgi:hypothetical protein
MQIRLFHRLGICAIFIVFLAVACSSEPETQILMEVTREVTVVVVVTTTPGDGSLVEQTASGTPIITETPVEMTLEPTVDPFPTPIKSQIIVAEEEFERGKMIYLQPDDIIWVMIYGDEGADMTKGVWTFHDDTWSDGMPEFDPTIIPIEGMFQPIRGFGKLWRENDAIREALGWAVDTEFGHITQYEYFPGGEVNDNGDYIPGPGYHTLITRDGVKYIFNEVNGMWRVATDGE